MISDGKQLVVIIGSLNVGGAENHLATILPHLVDKDWKIEVLVLTQKGALAAGLEQRGVHVNTILTPKEMIFFKKLPNFLGRSIRIVLSIIRLSQKIGKKPDAVIHFFLPEAYVLGMVGALLAGHRGPKVMSRRSLNNYYKRRPGIGWCEKRLFGKTTLISGNSQAVVSQLEAEGIPLDRLKLIYNGINLAPFQSAKNRSYVRTSLKISDDTLVMVMVANLIPYKGYQDLLNALAKIKELLPINWHLLCVGRDDGIGNSLKEQAINLSLSNHISWLGSRSDVPDLLMASDIGILCSHEEGFSNAVLEGMAAGLPMVVTDVGGNAEAVLNGKTGFVVAARHPEGFAQAMLKLASNMDEAKKMGELGQKRVREIFSLEACVNAYEALYDKCFKLNQSGSIT